MNDGTGHRGLDPFRDFQREVGRLFEGFEPLQTWRLARPYPAVNLYDAGAEYILTALLPGMAPEELDLSITGESLTMKGERTRAGGVADESYRRQERMFGRWTRTISIPDRVESAQVSASFSQGVLTVHIPKAESARPRQISVSSSG